MVDEKKQTVVFAGGGTGGHISPGIAVAEVLRLRHPSWEIRFIGSATGLESKMVPSAGFDVECLPWKSRGMSISAFPGLVCYFVKGRSRCKALLKEWSASCVVGLGGYASASPLSAGFALGIPTVLLEQNAIPGRANRFFARWAKEVLLSFSDAASYFGKTKTQTMGNPVRQKIIECENSLKEKNGLTILITGGSQGARALNDVGIELAPWFAEKNISVIHLAGRDDECKRVLEVYNSASVSADVMSFCDTMGEVYASCDVVLARAGATTCAEVLSVGLPSVLVPYPYARDDHQSANAKSLENAGVAVVVKEGDLFLQEVCSQIKTLFSNSQKRLDIAEKAKKHGHQNAAEKIADRIEWWCEQNN